MNTELKRTLTFAATAAVLMALAAAVTWPRGVTSAEAFSDQGEPFFPDFTDPNAATALEVIDFNPETASAIPFKVAFKDGRWVIPSHHDYPADGKDRLARTAAGVIDLKKDAIASDSAELHEEMGVVDPLDARAINLQGRGKRVTLRDEKGRTLADFIIGRPVTGRDSQRYVRVPDQKRTYKVNVDVDLSARFPDWIETNLLDLSPASIRSITIDNHTVDPERGTVQPGDVVTLERPEPGEPFQLDEAPPPGRELDTSKVSELTSALGDLKIAGVRAKPPGFVAVLKGETNTIDSQTARQLRRQGFHITERGQLLSNQGDVLVATDEGISYVLQFGEVTFATGDALTAGTAADEDTEGSPDPNAEPSAEGATESRYLFVTARFQPELIETPEVLRIAEARAEAADSELPADPFARTPEEKQDEERRVEEARKEYEQTLEAGKTKARELTDRFAPWYYLVPGDAFRKVVVNREGLTRAEGSEEAPASGLPPGFDFPGAGMPGMPSMPPHP